MFDLFIGTAHAQSGGAAPAGGGASMLLMFGMVFAIMYFLMIRPQNKRMQAHAQMVAALKKGDQLVTVGGVHGKVAAVEEGAVQVEIAKGIKVKVDKDKVARVVGPPGADVAESK